MRIFVRGIKVLGLVWGLAIMALGLRFWSVENGKRTALEIIEHNSDSSESGLEIRELNFLRGDYMVTEAGGLSQARHWTVNIRTGLVIGWETGGGHRWPRKQKARLEPSSLAN